MTPAQHPNPAGTLQQDALSAWLRQDLHVHHGPLEPLPADMLALIEAATLPN